MSEGNEVLVSGQQGVEGLESRQQEGGIIPSDGGALTTSPTTTPEALPLQQAYNPLDLPSEVFNANLDRRKQNRDLFMAWVRSALIDDVDFGRVKTRRGMSKPTLRKPGAEKICGMLGVTANFPSLLEYERAALSGVAVENIILRCELKEAGGRIVAEGVGARSLKQDYGDLNKALKMAEKSAMIDATLRMGGLSEIFTQDLEDMNLGGNGDTESVPVVAARYDSPEPYRPGGAGKITDQQIRQLEAVLQSSGANLGKFCEYYKVDDIKELTQHSFEKAVVKLNRKIRQEQ